MKNIKNKGLLITIIFYGIITIYLTITQTVIYTNIINPIFWTLIIFYIKWYMKKVYIRFDKNKSHLIYIIIISLMHIIIFFNIGFIFGFSKSPYNYSFMQIIKNMCIQIIPIIGIEITRGVLVNRNKSNRQFLFIISVLLFLLEIKYNIFYNLISDKEGLFKYISSTIIPLLSESILCTYLVEKESYLITLIYKVCSKLVILILPILPNINWFIFGSANILSTTIVYILFKYKFMKTRKYYKRKNNTLLEKTTYVVVIILSIFLVCFMLGLFKYEPIVILSNSMNPAFSRGDVVIYKKVDVRKINVNDIIIYSIAEQNIAHRVINITEEDGILYFQTKGDNNNAPDMLRITENNIKGVYALHVKYAGFPSVWLHDYFNKEAAKVETK